MKNLLLAVAAVVLIAIAAPAAGVNGIITTNLPVGISWVGAGGTSNALSSAILKVEQHEEVAVQYHQRFNLTNGLGINTTTLILGASQVPSNLVEIARITRPVQATTNTLDYDVGTNVYLGSFKYFGVISFVSGATNSVVTNSAPDGTLGAIQLQFKANRSGPN